MKFRYLELKLPTDRKRERERDRDRDRERERERERDSVITHLLCVVDLETLVSASSLLM